MARDSRVTIQSRIVAPSARPVSGMVLLAHDGPEFERVAALTTRFPREHVALLSPGSRNEWYSANPAYAAALAHDVLPNLPPGPVVALGASLGALALLHTETRYPGSFAGLFLQSGSYFTAELDPQESAFPWYRRILAFVQRARPVGSRVVLTCGRDEENLLNNRAMATRLGVPLLEVPGGHSMTTWRDALDPHLHRLLQEVNDDHSGTHHDHLGIATPGGSGTATGSG
ncbi:alpha/beta hydrolase-fold protein [Dactylosporangium sp. NPDC000244]|uniref:alpha/beta hydrolase-fold protein n=1 Tax=Dactylosporangium sp. NPDC000244 TaxID=3154365 RepID=UPI00331A2BCE